MELSAFFLALAVWFLVSAISRAAKGSSQRPRAPHPPQRPAHLTLGRYPTPEKGGRIDLVLGELQRALEEAGETQRPIRKPAVGTTEMGEGRSLEIEPEATSLEDEISRSDRRQVDQDDEAEQIVARRIQAAAARDQADSSAKRPKRGVPIPQEPADHTAVHGYTRQQLRDAMVWREILGPPVSER